MGLYGKKVFFASINRSMQACLILAIVGCMIASWMAAGTIPSMMYYGIKVISPSVFLLTACILLLHRISGNRFLMVHSRFHGCCSDRCRYSAWFSGIMTAGAVVSGAYFGDKMSPLSGYYKPGSCYGWRYPVCHIKHMVVTTGTSMVIALVAYGVMGFMHSSKQSS